MVENKKQTQAPSWAGKGRQGSFQSLSADSWDPQNKGECIYGEITRRAEVRVRDETITFIDIRQEGGEPIKIWLNNASLKQVSEHRYCRVGCRIGLRFDGLHDRIKVKENFMKLYSIMWDEDYNESVLTHLREEASELPFE